MNRSGVITLLAIVAAVIRTFSVGPPQHEEKLVLATTVNCAQGTRIP